MTQFQFHLDFFFELSWALLQCKRVAGNIAI